MEQTYLNSAHSLPPLPAHRYPVDEILPFTVRVVRSEVELRKAVQVRHLAYGRHLPDFAQTLRTPEPMDTEKGVVVLLAEAKLDGAPLGTMRIQTSRYRPLVLEQSIDLPQRFQGRLLAEATRLGVVDDKRGRLVKTALFKAYYEHCKGEGVEWMVIAGRSPIDRQYERLMFEDVWPDRGYIPLRHAGDLPHRVMALAVSAVYPKWKAACHPLYDYFFNVRHADIDLRVASETTRRPLAVREAVEA